MDTQNHNHTGAHGRAGFFGELAALGPLAVPVAISLLSHAVMTLVDTLFIARLGASALAGAGIAGTAYFTVIAFAAGAARAGKTLTAQRDGAGHDTATLLYRVMKMGLLLTAFTLVLGVIVAVVLPNTLQSDEAQDAALTYFCVLLIASPFDCIFMVVREWHYGRGDTRRPMRASVLANALNIGLDAVFVVGFDAGVGGIAAATAIAAAVQCLWLTVPHARTLVQGWMRRHNDVGAARDRATLIRFGVPLGVQHLVETGAFFVLTMVLAMHSDIAVAAHQVALQFVKLGFLPAVAVGEAAAVRAGRTIGARSLRGVRPVLLAALFAIVLYAGVAGSALAYFRFPLLALLTDDQALLTATAPLFVVAGLFLVPDGVQMVLRGVLRGVGDMKWSAYVSMVNAWVVTPPLAYVLVVRLDHGAVGGWWALTVEIAFIAILLGGRLASRQWHRHARTARRAAIA